MPTVIAIDGPAGAGKSTIGRMLAEDLGWAYLDSGAMYRALTVLALREGVDLEDSEALTTLARRAEVRLAPDGAVSIDGTDVSGAIRTAEVSGAVSKVALVPGVRERMVEFQRAFADEQGRIVADGRDMATIVFPDAEVMIYLDASEEERARRRRDEGVEGEAEDLEAVRARMAERDRIDSTREVAPLRQAEGADTIDTTGMTLAQVFEAVRSRVRSAIRS